MEVLFPRTVEELQKLMKDTPDGLIMAGGTDLLVKLRRTGRKPPAIFCTERINELQQVDVRAGEVAIGSAVTLQRLLECNTVQTELTALFQALSVLASPPVRHSATLTGNLCTASPAGDTLPPLNVLGAEVEVCSSGERRRQPVAEFITGPGETTLKVGKIVTAVIIPRPTVGTRSVYFKVGRRKAMAIAVASMAACIVAGDDEKIQNIKLAWGSVGPTVVTAPDAEAYLMGRSLSFDSFRKAGLIVADAVDPIDDVRASADYRRRVAGNLLLRLCGLERSE